VRSRHFRGATFHTAIPPIFQLEAYRDSVQGKINSCSRIKKSYKTNKKHTSETRSKHYKFGTNSYPKGAFRNLRFDFVDSKIKIYLNIIKVTKIIIT
jgi:hypothetical protein